MTFRIRDRIIEFRRVKAAELVANPKNWRRHPEPQRSANARNVWNVKKVNQQSMVHLTEKPVELASRAIQYSSRLGENVLDLFGGSGSTLIACEQHGRRAYLMELDLLYADVIVQRWERFTGKKAKCVKANTKEAVGA